MKQEKKTVRIEMTETATGSPNGYIVHTYYKGKEYNVPERLGKVFEEAKVAKILALQPEAVEDAAAEGDAPKNKATRAPKNKAV